MDYILPYEGAMPKTAKSDTFPNLYQVHDHKSLKIIVIAGSWDVRRSLNQLGLHAGDCVQVVCRAPFGGPLVIDSHGAHVAVGKQLAEQVQVELLP